MEVKNNRAIYWKILKKEGLSEKVKRAKDILQSSHDLARQMSPLAFYRHLLLGCNLSSELTASKTEIKEHLIDFLTQIQTIEKINDYDLGKTLAAMRDRELVVKAPEKNVQGVRILTVHGAKGCEAPVVVLPDTASIGSMRDHLLWVKKSNEE